MVISLPMRLVKRHLSSPNCLNLKSSDVSTLINSLYQFLPDCFKPYRDLFSFQTLPLGVEEPGGGTCTRPPLVVRLDMLNLCQAEGVLGDTGLLELRMFECQSSLPLDWIPHYTHRIGAYPLCMCTALCTFLCCRESLS